MEIAKVALTRIASSPPATFATVAARAVARWDNGQIAEENLFYDVVGMIQQLGLSS